MSTVSCEDIYRNTFFLLDWNLTKMSLQMNREPQTFSLSLNSLLKGFCCLAFISGTHVCRKGDKLSSACLNRYIRVFMGGKKSLCPPVWIMRQFRRSSGEDNQMKKKQKTRIQLVCTANNVMLWQATSLFCADKKIHNCRVSLVCSNNEGLWWSDVGKIKASCKLRSLFTLFSTNFSI